MKSQILISLSLLLLGIFATNAQPTQSAGDFFHGGALHYLSNNIPAALQVVTNGLQQFPNDEKLKKLHELLNQQQQQQSQQNQQNQQQKQQDQSQSDQQEENEKENQQSKEDQEPKDQQNQDQQPPQSGEQESDSPPEQNPKPMTAHSMTPEEARRLLDAQKDEEQFLQFKPEKPPPRTRRFKDW